MTQVFLDLIHQLNAAVFTLIVVLCVLFWVVYKSGGWVKSYNDFESKNDKLDTKIDQIKDNIASVKATTDLLYQVHVTTVKSHSPISLTTRGQEISSAINAEVKLDGHWDAVKSAVEKRNPVNPYDIQIVALDVARACFDTIFTHQEKEEVKTYAFSAGLNMLEIYPIFGVLIRDRIFKERDIKTEEVDKHDPSKQQKPVS